MDENVIQQMNDVFTDSLSIEVVVQCGIYSKPNRPCRRRNGHPNSDGQNLKPKRVGHPTGIGSTYLIAFDSLAASFVNLRFRQRLRHSHPKKLEYTQITLLTWWTIINFFQWWLTGLTYRCIFAALKLCRVINTSHYGTTSAFWTIVLLKSKDKREESKRLFYLSGGWQRSKSPLSRRKSTSFCIPSAFSFINAQ